MCTKTCTYNIKVEVKLSRGIMGIKRKRGKRKIW